MDLVKILEKVPVGTPLYSMVDGIVHYKEIDYNNAYQIVCVNKDNDTCSYTTDGKALKDSGECILFPSKDNKNWDDFVKYTFKPFDKVLVRDHINDYWELTFFAYIDESNQEGKYCTINGARWVNCIPYEGNEYLLGTIEEK